MATEVISNRKVLLEKYLATRQRTETLCQPLQTEDYLPQPIADVSPPRWHLAHTTWFFETFLLQSYVPRYEPVDPLYNYLFNSYYQNAGDQWVKDQRGLLSRPTVQEVYDYRHEVDHRMEKMLEQLNEKDWPQVKFLIETGINHEQQHQELLIYDIKYILCFNPLQPTYGTHESDADDSLPTDYKEFVEMGEGVYQVGYQGDGFCYDNEQPVQKVYVPKFKLRKGLVTNEEYLAFIEDGGYENFNYWLDDGWTWLKKEQVKHPLYWKNKDGQWYEQTLNGERPLALNAPVTHIGFYEAEAYASWAGMRLPTEFEWEVAAMRCQPDRKHANLQDNDIFQPMLPLNHNENIYQMYGDVWEWTYSSYLPYHNYKPAPGALGEYNGKFMINQMVLRGGSCATPADHIRKSYRNFFQPEKRWLFSGLRLAR